MENTKIKLNDYGLSGRQCDVSSTAFVENGMVLIVVKNDLKY